MTRPPLKISDQRLKELCHAYLIELISRHDYDLLLKDRGQSFVDRVALGGEKSVQRMLRVLHERDLLLL